MIDKEWLEIRIAENKSNRSMAEERGVAQSTIRHWMKKYGLVKHVNRAPVHSDEDLISAIAISSNWREVCLALKGSISTRSQTHLAKRAKALELDISHFPGNSWSKGKRIGPKRPIEEYLVENSTINCSSLRNKLIQEGVFEGKCFSCGISEWRGETNIFDLDHINSDHWDNRLENLQLLCPNCHRIKTREDSQRERLARLAAKKIGRSHLRKVIRPSAEELTQMLWSKPTSQLAKEFGVSDAAIGKWAKSYGISKPPRGYWAKIRSETGV